MRGCRATNDLFHTSSHMTRSTSISCFSPHLFFASKMSDHLHVLVMFIGQIQNVRYNVRFMCMFRFGVEKQQNYSVHNAQFFQITHSISLLRRRTLAAVSRVRSGTHLATGPENTGPHEHGYRWHSWQPWSLCPRSIAVPVRRTRSTCSARTCTRV